MSNIFTTETEGNASLKRKINSEGDFEVDELGYNGFMQLGEHIFEVDLLQVDLLASGASLVWPYEI